MSVEQFPERLRLRREQKGVKQHIFSELCGFDRGTIRRYERGEMEAVGSALVAIADKLDVSVDFLLGRTDNPQVNR